MVEKIHSYKKYKEDYIESVENPDKFWGDIAEGFVWRKKK